MKYETAIVPTVLRRSKDGEAHVGDCIDEGRIAKAFLDYQFNCRCKSCRCEMVITGLRDLHLFDNPPCGDVDPDEWPWSMAVCEPFTTTEAKLLDTNDEQLIRFAYPALASLIERELRARYEGVAFSHEMRGRPRGTSCAAATRH